MALDCLRNELNCSVCLNVCSNPVMLTCGHNYCLNCISRVLDSQETSEVYSCPECREQFTDRPKLPKNLKLSNIVENGRISEEVVKENRIFCTYCESDIPASKTCLHCEASLCDNHLKKHSKSVEHVLVDPTASLEDRKCSIHNEAFKYYCSQEAVCVCVSCCLIGEHHGHQVELLSKASEKHSEKYKKTQMELSSHKDQAEKDLEMLHEQLKNVQAKSVNISERITTLMRGIRGEVYSLERSVLAEKWMKEKQLLLSISDLIRQREKQRAELSKKIQHIEELCSMTDPLTVLKQQQQNTELHTEDHFKKILNDVNLYLSESEISLFLHDGMLHFSDCLLGLKQKVGFPIPEIWQMLFNANTACQRIMLSSDRKTASHNPQSQNWTYDPERFRISQVLSTCEFFSGQHYWEVDLRDALQWCIGVVYESIPRNMVGKQAFIGFNEESWSLMQHVELEAYHNNNKHVLCSDSHTSSLGIYLNYDSGILSFYDVSHDKKHLMTFSHTFTQPLHAAFCLFEGTTIRITKYNAL